MVSNKTASDTCLPTCQPDKLKIHPYQSEDLLITTRQTPWHPPTDVFETDLLVVISVEIAGMTEKGFQLSIENHKMTIYGNRSLVSERKIIHQSEIQYGDFETSIDLPMLIDLANVLVAYENGFLRITFHKLQNITV